MAIHGAYRELTSPLHTDQSRDIAISEMRSLRSLPSREALLRRTPGMFRRRKTAGRPRVGVRD